MKILQVVPYFVPAWDYGGPVSSVYNMSKQLVKRGHQVTVYTTDALNAKSRLRERVETLDGIEVRRFRNFSNTMAYHYNVFLSPGMISATKKEISSFDIIHLNEYRTVQNVVISRYARIYGTPYILQARGSLPRIITRRGLKKVYDNIWGYSLLKDASKVIAITQIETEQYKRMQVSEDKIEIVPNGVDLTEFSSLPPRGEFKEKWGISNSHKMVLFLSRIHQIKGLDILVQAFAKLLKTTDDVKLVIAGPDDGYLPPLKEMIKESSIAESVILTGPLYGREKLAAYVDAEVYVLPSSYDIFGITVLEACACGTPVIVTDRCGIANAIDDKAGTCIPYDNQALFEAIRDILGDNDRRQEFGKKGKSLVGDRFNWEKIGGQIEDIYLRCCER